MGSLSDFPRALAPDLAYAYLSLVGKTSSVSWRGLEHYEAVRGGAFLYAFWHQRQAVFTYTHRGERAAHVLVSQSRDGDLIAGIMNRSAIPVARGSSSRRAGPAAKELLDLLRRGKRVGLTPDGPRGPAREVKPGVLFLARASGCPILPLTSAVSRRLVLAKSWDRFHVPLPFSRILIHHAPPLRVRPEDDLAEKARELKSALDRITEEADAWAVG